jgi:hypothetical protein
MQRFERRVEDVVNRIFARTFKAEVQPVEIAAALKREADDKVQVLSRDRSMVPNAYVVELGPHDHERLAPWAEPLAGELAEMVTEHAHAQGYTPAGSVHVELALVDALETGVFRVRSRVDPHAAPSPSPAPGPAVRVPAPPSPWRQPLGERPATPTPGIDATAVLRPAQPKQATRWLEVDGRRYPLHAPVTIIGRGADADVRLSDPGVSRRHAQVQLLGPHVRVVDLGSTNGTVVHGRRVASADLRDGESFVLGQTTVTVRIASSADLSSPPSIVPGLR